MYKAWQKGISTYEFRKCLTEDLEFIQECEIALNERIKEEKHNAKVQAAMENLKGGKW